MVERAGIGGAGVAAPSAAIAGSVAGHLGRPAGSFDNDAARMGGGGVGHKRVRQFIELAQGNGRIVDPCVRQDIARLYTLVEITTWHVGRTRTGNAATGGEGNLAKLRNSDMTRLAREIAASILGPGATIAGSDSPTGGDMQELIVFSPAPSIYGGTDQVQRNIIGERVLGLPKEPGPPSATPFKELLQNPAR
jgi:alkylation response protein AidB-like acyl-CoA dehydrogenase